MSFCFPKYKLSTDYPSFPFVFALSFLCKAETRKEEIVRFSKAKNDPEFSKMLKSRTLGPDAAETQSQLRRQIQVCFSLTLRIYILTCLLDDQQ